MHRIIIKVQNSNNFLAFDELQASQTSQNIIDLPGYLKTSDFEEHSDENSTYTNIPT